MTFNTANQTAGYDETTFFTDYLGDMKRLTIPVAGPPGTPAVTIQTAAPVGSKVVNFSFQRTGLSPQIPSMQPANSNEVLKTYMLRIYGPSLMTEGQQHIYRVEGTYVFDLLLPLGPLNVMPAPVMPYDANPVGGAGVQPGDYLANLLPAETVRPVAVNLITR